jgi:hypothetical protein
MDYKDRKGGKHGAKASKIVHGASNQGSRNIVAVKCQNSQVLGTGSRSKRNPFGPDGPTQIPVCQHMRGSLRQMVGVLEESSTQMKLFNES